MTYPAGAVSVDTVAGRLLVPDDDTIIRPCLERDSVWSPD